MKQKSDERYSYNYQVFNQTNSIQEIDEIYLKDVPKNIISGKRNADWDFSKAKRIEFITWKSLGEIPKNIAPGDTSAILAYSSRGIPLVRKYFLRGKNRSPLLSEISLEERVEDIYTNSFIGHTLGPWLPDSSLSLQDFTDTLQTFRHRSCEELNWVTNHGICNSLEVKIRNVKRHIERGQLKQARNVLGAFLNEVDAQRGKHITEEGYALLYFNARYLRNQLNEPAED